MMPVFPHETKTGLFVTPFLLSLPKPDIVEKSSEDKNVELYFHHWSFKKNR